MEDLVILVAVTPGPLRELLDRELPKRGYTVMLADDITFVWSKLTYNPAPVDVVVLCDTGTCLRNMFSRFVPNIQKRFSHTPVIVVGERETPLWESVPEVRRDDPEMLPKLINTIERFRKR